MRPGPLPLGARVRSDSGGCFPGQPALSIKRRDRGLSYRGWGKKVRALSFSGPQPRPMTAFKEVDSVLEKTGAPWVTRTPGLQIRSAIQIVCLSIIECDTEIWRKRKTPQLTWLFCLLS